MSGLLKIEEDKAKSGVSSNGNKKRTTAGGAVVVQEIE